MISGTEDPAHSDVVRAVQQYYGSSDLELAQRYHSGPHAFGTTNYFEATLAHRYSLYPEIPEIARFDDFAGRAVLEVGVGQGPDHYMFARGGARMAGIDVTEKHCRMTGDFLEHFGLTSRLSQADACALPFADASFDHVYSCGVLMLTRPIEKAIQEIWRVLRPGGTTTIMVYNKRSVHRYIKSLLFYGWALNENSVIGRQAVNDWYTDGPGYIRVDYIGSNDMRRYFSSFRELNWRTSCLGAEQIPLRGLPKDRRLQRWLANRFGFFLWLQATK